MTLVRHTISQSLICEMRISDDYKMINISGLLENRYQIMFHAAYSIYKNLTNSSKKCTLRKSPTGGSFGGSDHMLRYLCVRAHTDI